MRKKRFVSFRGTVTGLSSSDEDDEALASDPFQVMRQDGVWRQGTEVIRRETAPRSTGRKRTSSVTDEENAQADAFLAKAEKDTFYHGRSKHAKAYFGRRDTTRLKTIAPILDAEEELPEDPWSRRRVLTARRRELLAKIDWREQVMQGFRETGSVRGLSRARRDQKTDRATLASIEEELRILNRVLGPPKSVIVQAPQQVPATSAALAGPREKRGLN